MYREITTYKQQDTNCYLLPDLLKIVADYAIDPDKLPEKQYVLYPAVSILEIEPVKNNPRGEWRITGIDPKEMKLDRRFRTIRFMNKAFKCPIKCYRCGCRTHYSMVNAKKGNICFRCYFISDDNFTLNNYIREQRVNNEYKVYRLGIDMKHFIGLIESRNPLQGHRWNYRLALIILKEGYNRYPDVFKPFKCPQCDSVYPYTGNSVIQTDRCIKCRDNWEYKLTEDDVRIMFRPRLTGEPSPHYGLQLIQAQDDQVEPNVYLVPYEPHNFCVIS